MKNLFGLSGRVDGAEWWINLDGRMVVRSYEPVGSVGHAFGRRGLDISYHMRYMYLMTETNRPKPMHDARDLRSGRYKKSNACDCCGKPVGTEYCTDDEVCGGGDGPGFYLCQRKRCEARRDGLTVEQRRALYVRRPDEGKEAMNTARCSSRCVAHARRDGSACRCRSPRAATCAAAL